MLPQEVAFCWFNLGSLTLASSYLLDKNWATISKTLIVFASIGIIIMWPIIIAGYIFFKFFVRD